MVLKFWKSVQNWRFCDFAKIFGKICENHSVQWAPDIQQDRNPLAPKLSWSKPTRFFFWGYTMNHVFRVEPNSIEDLKSVVNDFAHAMDPDLIKKVCSSARSRFEKWGLSEEAILNNFKLMNPNYVTIIMIFMNVWMNEWMK